MDRASLINDAFSLAESKDLDYSIPLAMTQYLKKETKYVPWDTAYEKLTTIKDLLENTDIYPIFRKVGSYYTSLQC